MRTTNAVTIGGNFVVVPEPSSLVLLSLPSG